MNRPEKMLDQIEDVALEMRVELNEVIRLSDTIWHELFEGLKPEGAYERDYKRLQALYHMMWNALQRFEGEFSLLTGDGETAGYKFHAQRSEMLREINQWWNAPYKKEKTIT